VAKKSRTPAPPRPVQAPKRRSEPRDPRTTRIWIATVAGLLVVAAIVAGAMLAFGGTDGGGATASGDVCRVETVKAQGQGHVEKLPKDFEPASFPRTTGPHHPSTVVLDQYSEPVPQLNLVHNLEHGAVAVQYGTKVSQSTIDQITAWYRTDPRGLIVAPLPDVKEAEPLANKITLAAWVAEREDPEDPFSEITKQEGRLAICSGFDEGEFDDFLERYRAQGPELFELEQLQPGSQ
jgi:Protein of unknown function (DUF3105)